jgi:putative acetyltransferase
LQRKFGRRAQVGSVGMAAHESWIRKGVGTLLLGALGVLGDRAENWLGLTRIELTVFVDAFTMARLRA